MKNEKKKENVCFLVMETYKLSKCSDKLSEIAPMLVSTLYSLKSFVENTITDHKGMAANVKHKM